jgi:hypothetical protein
VIRASGQVSAQGHGLTTRPVVMVSGKGAFQQHLREHRLGMNVNALAEQDRSGDRDNEGNE